MRGEAVGESASVGGADPLRWLDTVIRSPGGSLRLTRGGSVEGRIVARWKAIPSADAPRLLTPVSGTPAFAALAQYNDTMSYPARLRKWIIGQALRVGVGRLLPDRDVILAGVDGTQDDLLGHVLPEILGEPVVPAIALGEGLRPNAKPVIQLIRPDGKTLAYAKLGWNAITRPLVENEADALIRWEASPPSSFEVPRTIASFLWNDISVLVQTPMPHRLVRSHGRSKLPPARVIGEVAELDGIDQGPLADCPFFRRLDERSSSMSQDGAGQAASRTVDRVGQAVGDRLIRWGTAHGDWSPWNMSGVRGSLFVWDWERCSAGVPIGLDTLHYRFQCALSTSRPIRAVADLSLESAVPQLAELAVDASLHGHLLELYLADVLLRLEEGRRLGVPIRKRMHQELTELLWDGRGAHGA